MFDIDQETVKRAAAEVEGISGDYLRQYIERIERLEEEKAALTTDISEVYAEAKGNGFDSKIMRQIVRLRKLNKSELEEQDALLELYRKALGMSEDITVERVREVAHSHGIYNEEIIGEVAEQMGEQ